MPFTNPVVGGTTLIRPAIQSPNFATGQTGWSVNADGTAEFNNATLRGSLQLGSTTGPHVFENGAAPAEMLALTDFTWYVVRQWYFPAGIFASNSYYFEAIASNTNANDQTYGVTGIQFVTGICIGSTVTIEERRGVSRADISIGSTQYNGAYRPQLRYQGTDVIFRGSATLVSENPITADGKAETWHLVGLAAGWTNYGGGHPNLSVVRVPSPNNAIWLYGRVNVPAGAANGATVGTLPNGYWPTKPSQFPVDNWGAVNCVPGSVETDGTVKLWGTFSGNVSINALISLDGGA